MDKSIQDITVADVLRMIRQNEFMDIAIQRAIELLKENPFIGEVYDGELIEKISGLEPSLLKSCIPDIRNTLADALKKGADHEWSYVGEWEEIKQVVEEMLTKLES